MLTGFTLDESEWISLDEDTSDPRAEFCIRPVPDAKLDELRAKSIDFAKKRELSGVDYVEASRYDREIVRWGVTDHRHVQTARGQPLPVKRQRASLVGVEFDVLSDETISVYERTRVLVGDEQRPVSLLSILARRVTEAQTLTQAERRALPGPRVVAG